MADADRERWDARYRGRDGATSPPSAFLLGLDAILPRTGRALDVAGGAGRNALWLAARGFDVTIADVSPVALQIAGDRANSLGLRLQTIAVDLETDPLPLGPWNLILCVDFLWRPLFTVMPQILVPGGWLVVSHPTRSNLERHERPGEHHLLDDGELPCLAAGLTIVSYQEGWTDGGRHEARLVARRDDPVAR